DQHHGHRKQHLEISGQRLLLHQGSVVGQLSMIISTALWQVPVGVHSTHNLEHSRPTETKLGPPDSTGASILNRALSKQVDNQRNREFATSDQQSSRFIRIIGNMCREQRFSSYLISKPSSDWK